MFFCNFVIQGNFSLELPLLKVYPGQSGRTFLFGIVGSGVWGLEGRRAGEY